MRLLCWQSYDYAQRNAEIAPAWLWNCVSRHDTSAMFWAGDAESASGWQLLPAVGAL